MAEVCESGPWKLDASVISAVDPGEPQRRGMSEPPSRGAGCGCASSRRRQDVCPAAADAPSARPRRDRAVGAAIVPRRGGRDLLARRLMIAWRDGAQC